MIIKNIKIFLQNVYKNKLLTNTILEAHKEFDIIFIQELSQLFIQLISSFSNKKEEKLIRASNQITFSRINLNNNDSPRVISYMNIRLFQLHFFLQKDIFNYRNISCFSFFNNSNVYFLISIYSDLSQAALKYLKDIKANINNVLIIVGDFNIRNSSQDLSFLYYSYHCDLLTDIVVLYLKSLRADLREESYIR